MFSKEDLQNKSRKIPLQIQKLHQKLIKKWSPRQVKPLEIRKWQWHKKEKKECDITYMYICIYIKISSGNDSVHWQTVGGEHQCKWLNDKIQWWERTNRGRNFDAIIQFSYLIYLSGIKVFSNETNDWIHLFITTYIYTRISFVSILK